MARGTRREGSVWTPHGRAYLVWEFPDGRIAVEYPHGGGEVLYPGEVRDDGNGEIPAAVLDPVGRAGVVDVHRDGRARAGRSVPRLWQGRLRDSA